MAGSMRERRKEVWELRVALPPERPGGRWREINRTFYGKKRAAEKELNRLVNQYVNVRSSDVSGTVADYLENRWWPHWSASGKSPRTVREYRRRIDTQIVPAIGGIRLTNLSAWHLDSMYRAMTEAGAAPATVRYVHAICSVAFAQAVKWQMMPSNPARDASPPSVPHTELAVPTDVEVARLITAAPEVEPMMLPVLVLAVNTGMRRGELCGLRLSDVDLVGRRVTVRRSVVNVSGELIAKSPKTKQVRHIDFSPETAEVITQRIAEVYALAAFAEVDVTADPYLFSVDATGAKPLDPDFITRRFGWIAKATGLSYRFHDLRHFFCTHLMVQGFDPLTVAALAGHASPKMTMDVYGGRVDERLRAAGAAMRFGGGA